MTKFIWSGNNRRKQEPYQVENNFKNIVCSAIMEVIRSVFEILLPVNQVAGLVHWYAEMPLFPIFSTVHFLLTAIALRKEPGSLQFAFKYPIASCVMTFIVGVSGSVLANVVLARPPLEMVVNGWAVLTCLLCWYLIFFSPFDICYILTLATPIQLTLFVIEEFARAKKVFSGVSLSAAVYPESLLAMALVGMLKGSGKRWGITWYRLIYQPQSAGKLELLSISFVTKASFILAFIYAVNGAKHEISIMDKAYLVFLGGVLLSCVKLWCVLKRNTDPFSLPQELTWLLLTVLSFPPPSWNIKSVEERRAAALSEGRGGRGEGVCEGGDGERSRGRVAGTKRVTFSSDIDVKSHLKSD